MKKGITTDVLFWVFVALIAIIFVVLIAVWTKGYGINVLEAITGLIY